MFVEEFRDFDCLEKKGFRRLGRGKVREVFETFERGSLPETKILLAATDCVSAFDTVLPGVIRQKGEVLTQLSDFWFERTKGVVGNHRQGIGEDWPKELEADHDRLRRCVVVVWRAKPLPVECVVRGFLAGSAWKEYRKTGQVGGKRLPAGLKESEELPEPMFTPTTKAKTSHDENISFDEVVACLGEETAERVRAYSGKLYRRAREIAEEKGVLIADTKFEFGFVDGELMLIDEALTPDSSRFWLTEKYRAGGPQESFDKQMVRDYLEQTGWDKKTPAPSLPDAVVEKTRSRYLEIYERLTGKSLR